MSISPCVDRLIGIADNEKIAVFARKHACNGILLGADILEFINQNVLHPLLPFVQNVRKVLQDIGSKVN